VRRRRFGFERCPDTHRPRRRVRARHARRDEIRELLPAQGRRSSLVVALVLVPSVLLMVAAVLASELVSPGIGFSY